MADVRRSLILAGGGLKVAYQAGCLQVLLDEAKIHFDHVDAASGGCFNAAMMASGKTGTEIADCWRDLIPLHFTSLNWMELPLTVLWYAYSFGTQKGVQRVLQRDWHIDWKKIQSPQTTVYTFNHFNFAQKRVVVVENTDMDEELLLASVALVMWFPPIKRNGEYLFDAVYVKDSNVAEAVRRGADEIWAIWTVSDVNDYRRGFIAQYFHIIEAVANARFKVDWEEIEAVNAAIERHGRVDGSTTNIFFGEGIDPDDPPRSPAGRKKIKLNLIKQEVPVHYLLNFFDRDRVREAVAMGVRDTRAYLERKGGP
jgi:predicted acylesterase/phospholipase RssA